MKEWDENKREEIRQALPKLKKMLKMTDGSEFMKDIRSRIKDRIDIAERCIKFDIWTDCNQFEYGCGIYVMKGTINDPRYDVNKPEQLLEIGFPTGAYIFGDRYDTTYFAEYYKELHVIEPDYEDRLNNNLYYKPEHARAAWDNYKTVTKKYMDNNKERARQWKIEQTKAELDRLMAESEG